ncbi:SDR family NAD(P)-dependent oxidoreductase [Paenibacillus silvae]|uniref:SDR family NAD(P)-dependent oxidoreductase n=1 Tax=Paenibacillus silvae TaxID=1325358 RepID=UPI0021B496AA|nr:SDR family NAD(P)-dependent oxidoreductase [Paenibacillus silvae]
MDVRKLDLSNLSSIRAFANVMVENYDRLDILINNEGIMFGPYSKTVDGFENQFGTNHLGHFALTGLLMPLLKKTEASRTAMLSSLAHTMGNLDFEDLNWEGRKVLAAEGLIMIAVFASFMFPEDTIIKSMGLAQFRRNQTCKLGCSRKRMDTRQVARQQTASFDLVQGTV